MRHLNDFETLHSSVLLDVCIFFFKLPLCSLVSLSVTQKSDYSPRLRYFEILIEWWLASAIIFYLLFSLHSNGMLKISSMQVILKIFSYMWYWINIHYKYSSVWDFQLSTVWRESFTCKFCSSRFSYLLLSSRTYAFRFQLPKTSPQTITNLLMMSQLVIFCWSTWWLAFCRKKGSRWCWKTASLFLWGFMKRCSKGFDRWDNGMLMAPTHILVRIVSDTLAQNLLCLNSPLLMSHRFPPSGNIFTQSFSALSFGKNRNWKNARDTLLILLSPFSPVYVSWILFIILLHFLSACAHSRRELG